MITKDKLIDFFGRELYEEVLRKREYFDIPNIDIISNGTNLLFYSKVEVDNENFYVEIIFDQINEGFIEKKCSCGKENCEHMVATILEISNYTKNEISSKIKRFSSDRILIPLKIILDFSSLRDSSIIRIRFDLADKKLARSPKNYIYEYIIDDTKTIKVTPEDDRFLRMLITENNIYTYPDEGISLSMSQFLRIFDLLKSHPRVYLHPSDEKIEFLNEKFMPKLRISYEQTNEIKKLKIITEEDYSNILIIADGENKKIVIGNKILDFSNPIPIETWLVIFENRFKISEKEFPKFFGKFYSILYQCSKLVSDQDTFNDRPNIVQVDKVDIKIKLDYNEAINKLHWESIIIFDNRSFNVKDIFDVSLRHIELFDNYYISDIKELKKKVVDKLFEIGLEEYFISNNYITNYIPIEKEEFVRKILANYEKWKDFCELTPRTSILIPQDVRAVFDIDIINKEKGKFDFSFKVFFLENSNTIVKEFELEKFIKILPEVPSDAIIEVKGRYYRITNLEEVKKVSEKIKDIIDSGIKESNIVKLIQILSLEAEIDFDLLSSTLVIRKDENTRIFQRELKELKPSIDTEVPEDVKNTIREYQKVGYYWLRFLYKNGFGGILADDMGLGKTLQALTFIKSISSDTQDKKPSLVICPTSLTHNWVREIQKFFPSMSYGLAVGSPKERKEILDRYKNYDIIISSYALIRNDISLYLDKEFKVIVIDEAQYIKNKEAKTTKFVKMLNAEMRLALTGTPIENSVSDLWSIFDFIMPGTFGNYNSFMEKYSNPEKHKELAKKVSYFILRRKKEDVLKELPSKIEQNVFVPLSTEQRKIYEKFARDMKNNVLKYVGELGFNKSKVHILSAITRLKQICDHPALVSEAYENVESGKLELLIDLLNDAIDGGHKILVFSQFVQMLKIIEKRLQIEGIEYSYLDGSTKNRQEVINEFNENENKKVFLISLKAGGFGINLTSADIVILYDLWWNPMVERQAMDRAHRIGQTKTVNVYRLISEDTIEERISNLQNTKKELFSNIIESETAPFANLSWEDIKYLFE
jgi:SNF2 family DNA or RNA helicase